MRIISDFHDYYDSAAMQISMEPIWKRTAQVIADQDNFDALRWAMINSRKLRLGLRKLRENLIVVGFCGSVHVGLYRSVEQPRKKGEIIPTTLTFYDYTPQDETEREVFTLAAQHVAPLAEPIWVKTVRETRINCPLKPYEFFKVKSTFEAAQELDIYLSNLAAPEMPIPKADDRTKLLAAGFDEKWSFRKPSAAKK